MVALSMMAYFRWSWLLYFGWIRERFPGSEKILNKKEYALLLQQRIAPNRVSEKRMDQNNTFCFDGTKISMECSPAQFVIFVSKTGPMRT